MKSILYWIGGCTAILCLMGSGDLKADISMPFQDNWNQETAGDNANQLTWWDYESSYGDAPAGDTTVITVSGSDKALNMNPNGSESTGICSQRTFLGGSVLSIQTDLQLTTDGAGAGVLGFCENEDPLYGYVLAVSRGTSGGAWLNLRKFDGDLNNSFTTDPVFYASLNPLVAHTYRLDATFSTGQIAFDVFVDGDHKVNANLEPVDIDPYGFTNGLQFVLASNFGQQAYFDNFQAVPEPGTLALLACGGLLLKRKR